MCIIYFQYNSVKMVSFSFYFPFSFIQLGSCSSQPLVSFWPFIVCFLLFYKTYLQIVGSIQNELNDFLQKPTGNHVSANECDSGTNYLRQPRYHCILLLLFSFQPLQHTTCRKFKVCYHLKFLSCCTQVLFLYVFLYCLMATFI